MGPKSWHAKSKFSKNIKIKINHRHQNRVWTFSSWLHTYQIVWNSTATTLYTSKVNYTIFHLHQKMWKLAHNSTGHINLAFSSIGLWPALDVLQMRGCVPHGSFRTTRTKWRAIFLFDKSIRNDSCIWEIQVVQIMHLLLDLNYTFSFAWNCLGKFTTSLTTFFKKVELWS